uniref:F-box protein SKIP23 n=2 Tax=Cajanus cajan TaxID=3821 RepID=A0A151TCP0_CAJCA|nr:F-box protein SKIP23 [Cajanus cajan]
MGADWAELPKELVESISKLLTIYSDYLRFRSVCRSWRSSVRKTPVHLPPQLPWLMLSHRAFFDLSLHKTHLLRNHPQPPHTRICASSHGWLALLDHTPNLRLLNPLTRATRSLPPLHTFPNVLTFNHSLVGREYLVANPHGAVHTLSSRHVCTSFLTKLVLSQSPSRGPHFAALAIVAQNNLAFCRNGSDAWIFVNDEDGELYCWEDVVDYNGVFFAVSKGGTIAVCDPACSRSPPRVSLIQPTAPFGFVGDINYAVFSAGDFLLVTRLLDQEFSDAAGVESNLVYRTVSFEVFKMNWGLLTWQRLDTLGDRVLFVGGNSSLSFCASDFEGCSADCIYFTDDYSELNDDDACGKHDLGIFRLCDKSIEPLPCFPPGSFSQLGWPLPIWLSPNPC